MAEPLFFHGGDDTAASFDGDCVRLDALTLRHLLLQDDAVHGHRCVQRQRGDVMRGDCGVDDVRRVHCDIGRIAQGDEVAKGAIRLLIVDDALGVRRHVDHHVAVIAHRVTVHILHLIQRAGANCRVPEPGVRVLQRCVALGRVPAVKGCTQLRHRSFLNGSLS